MEVTCNPSSPFRDNVTVPTSLNIEDKGFPDVPSASSSDVSGASTPVRDSLENHDDFDSSEEFMEEQDAEIDAFVKEYVHWLFENNQDISYENKSKFGDLMKTETARMSFAKYIDAQRSQSKCVSETTFYKLVHGFALVLFECGEADDYMPGKTLMNMAFTYYYIPDQKLVTCDSFSSGESLSSTTSSTSVSGSRSEISSSDSDNLTKRKNSFMERFKKEVEACKQIFADTPSLQELKLGTWRSKSRSNSAKSENPPPYSRSVSENVVTTHHTTSPIFSPSSKIFLYEHLKNQVIWKSLRFWNAAFFSAVNHERKRRCIQKKWTAQSEDEKEMTNEFIVNITFGQLGTFINNMKCLGLSKKTCLEFLRKQSVIGGIEEGGQYHSMLVEQIEDDCTF